MSKHKILFKYTKNIFKLIKFRRLKLNLSMIDWIILWENNVLGHKNIHDWPKHHICTMQQFRLNAWKDKTCLNMLQFLLKNMKFIFPVSCKDTPLSKCEHPFRHWRHSIQQLFHNFITNVQLMSFNYDWPFKAIVFSTLYSF